MTAEEMRAILKDVEVPEFKFEIIERFHGRDSPATIFLRGHYREPNIVTGDVEDQYTGRWLMSVHMVKSEVVQTAFKCYIQSLEHQAREHFKYRGRRVFGPHFDVDSLWEICRHEHLDYRDKKPSHPYQIAGDGFLCDFCTVRVIPRSDGTCPICHRQLVELP